MHCQQTFESKKFADITQQCFALLPQVNFPANNLNFHWRWRWWDWIQAIFLNLFYFNFQQKKKCNPEKNTCQIKQCASLLKTGLKNQQNQENMDQKHSYEGYIVHKTATDSKTTLFMGFLIRVTKFTWIWWKDSAWDLNLSWHNRNLHNQCY